MTDPGTDLILIKLDTARNALVEAKTIKEVKKVVDIAKAMKVYAARQKLSEEIKGHAHAVWAEALKRWGEMKPPEDMAKGGEG